MGRDACRINLVAAGGEVTDDLGGGEAIRTGMCRVTGWAGSGSVGVGECHDAWFTGVACCCCPTYGGLTAAGFWIGM